MISADARLAWFAAALDELPPYLLSEELLWPLQRPPAQMRQDLTLGGLLVLLDGLRVEANLPPPARQRLSELEHRWSSLRDTHAAALEAKARKERRMRLNLWKAYLTDLGERPALAEEYSDQVRQRLMIERLAELGAAGDELRVDEALRRNFRTGPFVWDAALRRAYPPDRYWFLYGKPEV